MLFNFRNKLNKLYYDYICRSVLNTPPIDFLPDSKLVLLSQVYHPDVVMFILAAKSFLRFVPARHLVLVDDGLTESDRVVLKKHFPSVTFIPTVEVRNLHCPKGGCWGRFLQVVDCAQDNYVIQLDADTLTLQAPTEVLKCLTQNRSFTLGTSTGTKIVPVSEAVNFAETFKGNHIQIISERTLAKLQNSDNYYYVRGCAGFAGYAPRHLSRDFVEKFSVNMSALVGAGQWREWGSEQFTSNFMISNTPNPMVLPVDDYPFWKPGVDINSAKFVHFFGTFRFSDGMYLRQSQQIINQLSK